MYAIIQREGERMKRKREVRAYCSLGDADALIAGRLTTANGEGEDMARALDSEAQK